MVSGSDSTAILPRTNTVVQPITNSMNNQRKICTEQYVVVNELFWLSQQNI
jgi:hypothetical protein